ncbi:hypothetical protein OF829_15665 [Sphingomonas sp. LB-2]|uniref:peptidoglycan-binding domain-containing protein n=1 Tax=Sphingomonas caeni TaxID=2984949 RepID=UPI00222EF39D|nr:hypothetical protein [Sphingomonas caeni]MCW3848673.1 hypothetical protein [Sphingomonas caeni]
MAAISGSVGSGGVNNQADVLLVEQLLNKYLAAQGEPLLAADGVISIDTILTIQAYQHQIVGLSSPDGKIDPGGRTWKALDAGAGFTPAPTPAPGASNLSGAAWWHANEGKYPTSHSVDDLVKPFRDNAAAFIKALKDAGASVSIGATYRHPTRAHLMHYCVRVANGDIAPNKVPAVAGCDIQWDHGNLAASKQGAQEMATLFDIAFPASLTSLHIFGRAIDMTIGWNGTLAIKDAAGKTQNIGAPRSGNTNTALHKVGASYKVIKLASDPPHWSDNGH